MDDNTHAILSKHAKDEIVRLNELLVINKEKQSVRRKLRGMAEVLDVKLFNTDPEAKARSVDTDRYLKKSSHFLNIKIQIWNQLIAREKNPKMLDLFNDALNEFLFAGWMVMGQEYVVEDSQHAKEEYKTIKMILERLPDKVKKTRRGGKKHKNKNKQDEVK